MNEVLPWLTTTGKYPVEHIPCPHFSQPVDLTAPRSLVLHTTEGGWDGSMAVFKHHYAPHFIVGPGRIAQLVQVGTIGAALRTHNWLAIVQIEVVGFSKETPYDFDQKTLDALTDLLAVCKREYGVPLTHPWKDGDYGRAGDNPHRHAGLFGKVAGCYGHGDMPEPDEHWDPGDLKWSEVLSGAAAKTEIHAAAPWVAPPPPPHPCGPISEIEAWLKAHI